MAAAFRPVPYIHVVEQYIAQQRRERPAWRQALMLLNDHPAILDATVPICPTINRMTPAFAIRLCWPSISSFHLRLHCLWTHTRSVPSMPFLVIGSGFDPTHLSRSICNGTGNLRDGVPMLGAPKKTRA